MEGTHGVQQGPKKVGHPHHLGPKPETGYTDEAAEECHDLIDRAEEDAHLHDPNSMYSTTDNPEPVHRLKGSPEDARATGGEGGTSTTHKMQETEHHAKSTIGKKVEQMKEKMGMHK